MKKLPQKTTFIVCENFSEFKEIAQRYTHDRVALPSGSTGFFVTKNMAYQYAVDARTLLGRAGIIVEFYLSAKRREDYPDIEAMARKYAEEKRWEVKWHDDTYTHTAIKKRVEKQEREIEDDENNKG